MLQVAASKQAIKSIIESGIAKGTIDMQLESTPMQALRAPGYCHKRERKSELAQASLPCCAAQLIEWIDLEACSKRPIDKQLRGCVYICCLSAVQMLSRHWQGNQVRPEPAYHMTGSRA